MTDEQIVHMVKHDVVVVEGSKYSGKTTLCRELKAIGYKTYRTTRRPFGIKSDGAVELPHNMNIEDATIFVLDYLKQLPDRVAFDRSLISSAWFQKNRPGIQGRLGMMVEYMRMLRGVIVHLEPEWDVVHNRIEAARTADVEGSNVTDKAILEEREGIAKIIHDNFPPSMVIKTADNLCGKRMYL